MKSRRIRIVILVLIGLTIFLIMVRKPELETAGRTVSGDSPEDRSQSKRFFAAAGSDLSISASRPESEPSKAGVKVIASVGEGMVLKVMSDGTFQLSLSDSVGEIYVPVGKKFFWTTFSDSNPIPSGVWIKIRNANGEVLTMSMNPEGWHTPAISYDGGHVVFANEERELLRADQRTADFKVSNMLMLPRINLKNQGDLEFKLSVRSYPDDARDAQGEPLSPDAFPEFETDWLDGELLFVGE